MFKSSNVDVILPHPQQIQKSRRVSSTPRRFQLFASQKIPYPIRMLCSRPFCATLLIAFSLHSILVPAVAAYVPNHHHRSFRNVDKQRIRDSSRNTPSQFGRQHRRYKRVWDSRIFSKNDGESSSSTGKFNPSSSPLTTAAISSGLIAQPVVLTSLYYVRTTGAGLPAGPFGLLGALEGVSYLVVLGFCIRSLYFKATNTITTTGSGGLLDAVQSLSVLSVLAGLVTLGGLVVDQGCVPNAKPLLDYSAYLPVCTSSTPGIFGQ